MRTLREIPERSASASWVSPRSVRNATILAPTLRRARSQDATRSGLFWLGRVGTPQEMCTTTKCLPY